MDDDDLLESHLPEGQPDKRACPKCGSNDVRRSSRDSFWASLLSMVGRWPFRCRSCRSRFYRYSSPPPEN